MTARMRIPRKEKKRIKKHTQYSYYKKISLSFKRDHHGNRLAIMGDRKLK